MIISKLLRPALYKPNAQLIRQMSGHHTFPLEPSRWQWKKFKDLFHFYALLGVIPLTVLITGVNIFVGPATLSEIPEGYEPKYWEYYKSPITRWIARYMLTNPQQEYEKLLCHLFLKSEEQKLREVESQIKKKISERNDYQAYYYRPVLAKYHRASQEALDYVKMIRGD